MDDSREKVVLVDEKDNAVGLMEKMSAHDGPHLHRAFSVFIFNTKGQLLIQQRALSKYHSPGLWANTCCSHPRNGESLSSATVRRLKEEMGIVCEMQEIFSFIYQADVGKGLTEHEFDHVFWGVTDEEPKINVSEVNAWKYVEVDDLRIDMLKNAEKYTPWFHIAFQQMDENGWLKKLNS